jgi:hypothetical protein
MKIRQFIPVVVAVGLLPWTTLNLKAQLTLAGTNYVQTFDNLDSGLPGGWMVCTNAHATNLGTAVTFATNHISWSSISGQFQNCAGTGNAGTNLLGSESSTAQNNYTNRALAIRQGTSFGDPGAAFVLNLTNTSHQAGFQLELDLLMLSVQLRSTAWSVDYATGSNPTNFTAVAGYEDPGVFGTTHASIAFATALDNRASNVWIRIVALTGSTGSNYRDTFGIDNFSLSWTNLPSAKPFCVSAITPLNGSIQIDFAGDPADVVSYFTVQSASQASGSFTDTPATITQTNPGNFRAVVALNGSQQFYRIKCR